MYRPVSWILPHINYYKTYLMWEFHWKQNIKINLDVFAAYQNNFRLIFLPKNSKINKTYILSQYIPVFISHIVSLHQSSGSTFFAPKCWIKLPYGLTHFCPPFQHLLSERLTSLGIMGAPRVSPLNPSKSIVLSEHYRLWGV